MALIKCKECGKDISSEAHSCPHCGYSLIAKSTNRSKKNLGCITLLVVIILVFLVGKWYTDKTQNDLIKEIKPNQTSAGKTQIPQEALDIANKRSNERKEQPKVESHSRLSAEGKEKISYKVLACYSEKDANSVWLAIEAGEITFAKDALMNESCLWIAKGTPHNVLNIKSKTALTEYWINGETYLLLHTVLHSGLIKKN